MYNVHFIIEFKKKMSMKNCKNCKYFNQLFAFNETFDVELQPIGYCNARYNKKSAVYADEHCGSYKETASERQIITALPEAVFGIKKQLDILEAFIKIIKHQK